MIGDFFREIFWRPLFNGFVGTYTLLPWQDAGLAILVLTLIIQLILYPLRRKSRSSQLQLQAIQPELKRVQHEYRNNREAQGRAMMELYAKHRVNPFSGCLLLLVQLPILIALFEVFRRGFDPAQLVHLYSFLPHPGMLDPTTLKLLDLSKPNLFLGVFGAVTQYLQSKLTFPLSSLPAPSSPGGARPDMGKILQWQTLYLFPALILVWSYTLPSALLLYWTISNIFSIIPDVIGRRRTTSPNRNPHESGSHPTGNSDRAGPHGVPRSPGDD